MNITMQKTTTKQYGDNITVYCEVYSTRYSWGHLCRCYYKGQEITRVKVTYYNRTWERYQFESALCGIVHKLDACYGKLVPLSERLAMYNAIKA